MVFEGQRSDMKKNVFGADIEIWPPSSLVKIHPQGLLGMVSAPEFHGDFIFDGPEAWEG